MPAATYHVSALPNGLRVATAEMPACESLSVGLWAGAGGRHESVRTNGAAHFLEHLLFKGTRRRTPAAITREVEGLGGDLNAFTSEDHTCYFAKADGRHLARVTDVLLDMYGHSTFPAVEVERERGVIREEILMGKDQPTQVAEELLAREFWPGHALGRPLTGTEESLAGISRDDLMTFWRTHYGGRNTVFTVAGPVSHADILRTLGPALGPSAHRTARTAGDRARRFRPARHHRPERQAD